MSDLVWSVAFLNRTCPVSWFQFFWSLLDRNGATGRGTPRPVLVAWYRPQVCEYADLWHPNFGVLWQSGGKGDSIEVHRLIRVKSTGLASTATCGTGHRAFDCDHTVSFTSSLIASYFTLVGCMMFCSTPQYPYCEY